MRAKQPLPDVARRGCRVLFVGINPSLRSAALGHHYAGRGNRFWKLLYESGLVPHPITYEDDRSLVDLGLASTNIVDRPTRSCSDLSPADYEKGRKNLRAKILRLRPIVTAFVGVVAYREFFAAKGKVACGPVEERIGTSRVFVLPNPSGRNAHYPYPKMLAVYRELAGESELHHST